MATKCSFKGCNQPAVSFVDTKPYCKNHYEHHAKPQLLHRETLKTDKSFIKYGKTFKNELEADIWDRDIQFRDPMCPDTKNIKVECTKEQTFDYIKANPDGYDNFKQMCETLGSGCLKFRNELTREGKIPGRKQ